LLNCWTQRKEVVLFESTWLEGTLEVQGARQAPPGCWAPGGIIPGTPGELREDRGVCPTRPSLPDVSHCTSGQRGAPGRPLLVLAGAGLRGDGPRKKRIRPRADRACGGLTPLLRIESSL